MKILAIKSRFDTNLTIRKEWIPNVTFDTPYQINILGNRLITYRP